MSTKLQPINSKLSTRNKKIREFIDGTEVTALDLSADDVVKFAMFFIGIVFFLHIISSLIPSIPTNILISLGTGFFAIILSMFIFKIV